MMRKLIRRFRRDEGATLPLVALLLVVLLGLTAFGVDLGWIYLNASRIQRAADAGALAGVIRMPTDFPQATADAKATTKANTYEDGVDNAVVTVSKVTGQPNQLDVTVTDTIPTFFARVLGFETVTISRKARGEFVPPLKLGSPSNQFGNSCDPSQPGCSGQANFWANIHGEYTDTRMGDAYSSRCAGGAGSGNPGCAQNAVWRDRGYLYGIDANGAGSFTVEFNDLAFHNISDGQTTSDYIRTGDRGCEDWGNNSSSCGPTMYVALYAPDADPARCLQQHPVVLTDGGPSTAGRAGASYAWSSPRSCFTVTDPQAGTYVVQVKVVSGSGDGLNRYCYKVIERDQPVRAGRLLDLQQRLGEHHAVLPGSGRPVLRRQDLRGGAVRPG